MDKNVIICLVVIAIVWVIIDIIGKLTKDSNDEESNDEKSNETKDTELLAAEEGNSITAPNSFELGISFENLASLTEAQSLQLVEINDEKLLAYIDSAIPGTLQMIANTGAAVGTNEMVQQAGQIYRAIIPQGAKLDHSRAIEGTYRGSYRDVGNSIKGNANWAPVDTSSAKALTAVNAANAVMGVASMVVGQYYMTQINGQLGDISDSINNIADFQDNEYKSKVITLVTEVQKASDFRMEIMEDEELRKRELQHLKELETKCSDLLNQANITLSKFTKSIDLDYKTYESLVGDANSWYQYQQVLLQVMYELADLTHALNLGKVSKEYSYDYFVRLAKQTAAVQDKMIVWHESSCERLEIDLDAAWRKRQGVNGFFMSIPGAFKDDWNYKSIPKSTVQMIQQQSGDCASTEIVEEDLFEADVQLIAKDNKLYYLPSRNKDVIPDT